jgi:hypothetical protein
MGLPRLILWRIGHRDRRATDPLYVAALPLQSNGNLLGDQRAGLGGQRFQPFQRQTLPSAAVDPAHVRPSNKASLRVLTKLDGECAVFCGKLRIFKF